MRRPYINDIKAPKQELAELKQELADVLVDLQRKNEKQVTY
jgi:hypothetical protein